MSVTGYSKAQADTLLSGYARIVVWSGAGGQPARPPTAAGQPVLWICPTQPTTGGTVSSGTTAVAGLDVWFRTP